MTKIYPYAFSQDYAAMFEQIMSGQTLVAVIEKLINGHTLQRICEVRLMPSQITDGSDEISFSVVGYTFSVSRNWKIGNQTMTINRHFLQLCKGLNAKFISPNV